MNGEEELQAVRASKTDPEAFTPLYNAYHGTIFRFIQRRSRDQELSADLTQQTFLKALMALPRYEPRGLPFRAWLYRIALNELRMHWRRRKEVLIDLSYTQIAGISDELGLVYDEDDMRRLATAMGKLDEERAHLINLRYMDGMSFAEIGQVIGVAEDAAKMRVHRTLHTLRTYLVPRA
ncbi:MAG: sigma-70 family RNA polymerase sigma factor [Flavobacteriales bacterium]|nr:sigma-70 family RNA polymerase sigma factor [Flavobacteriales bacterium]MCC6939285.1 sigma-70 family RNA polymerase sigma factor [Flavobacteriales bacterium]